MNNEQNDNSQPQNLDIDEAADAILGQMGRTVKTYPKILKTKMRHPKTSTRQR